MSNIKMNHESLSKFWGQIPELDHVISLVGATEDQNNTETIYNGETKEGLSVCVNENGIHLSEIADLGYLGLTNFHIGSILVLNNEDYLDIQNYLAAYLLTNEEFLDPDEVETLKRLINKF